MSDSGEQLRLFESSTSRSRSHDPTSPPSSAREASSNAARVATRDAVTAIATTPHAVDLSSTGSAAPADTSTRVARNTEVRAAQPMLPIFTAPSTAAAMLAVQRPRNRSECRGEARPCPWVGCRQHLLIDFLTESNAKTPRPPKLVLNVPSADQARGGRRPGLPSSAAALVVEVWIEDALEALSRMRYTCALDVVDDYPQGLSDADVASLLGVTKQAINVGQREPWRVLRRRVRAAMGLDRDDMGNEIAALFAQPSAWTY